MVTVVRITLSEMASRIVRIDRGEGQAYDEMSVYGAPSECAGLISRGCDRARQKAFEEGGWTEEEFRDELRERVSNKWLFFHTYNW